MIQAFAENDKVELALAELAEAQAREESFFLNPVTGNNLIQSIIRYLFRYVNNQDFLNKKREKKWIRRNIN